MRSMYGPDQLLLASKKPRIRDLVSRSRTMTEEEIRSLPEKPDVIRGLLLINLFGEDQRKATIAEKVADLMQKKHVDLPSGDEKSCHVYRISTAGDEWLRTDSTMLEIKEGWHWALMADGTIYLANLPTRVDQDELGRLMGISHYVGKMDLFAFKELERKRRNSLQPDFIFPIT